MGITKKNLHIDIFATLRDRIVYLEYPPGMPLIEKDLCEEFKVSRTPLREAIRKLEEMRSASRGWRLRPRPCGSRRINWPNWPG